MTTAELHNILDDEDRTLTVGELKQIIYELKNDTLAESNKYLATAGARASGKTVGYYYSGESKAFQICLDLLEHLKI